MSDNNKTALGVDENIAGLLCYILGFINGNFAEEQIGS